MNYIIAIDQSTSSTKALLFDEQCHMVARTNVDHQQYYPQTGWVEHDAEEIYNNMIEAIRQRIVSSLHSPLSTLLSLSITNQRETAVVWNRHTGKPIARAVVWQDTRGAERCRQLRNDAKTTEMVRIGHREVVWEEQLGLSRPRAQHYGERL
jgi:glycerol kinase